MVGGVPGGAQSGSVDGVQWAQQLSRASAELGNLGGREVKVMVGGTSYTLNEIAERTNNLMAGVNDRAALQQAAKALGTIRAELLKAGDSDGVAKTYDVCINQLSGKAQVLRTQEVHRAFDSAIQLTWSGHGVRGVGFLVHPKGTMVLKVDDLQSAVVGDRLWARLGHNSPNSTPLDSDAKSVQDFLAKNELGPEAFENMKAQLAKPGQQLFIQDHVTGANFRDCDLSKMREACTTPEGLRQMGRMMIIDAFAGNADRFAGHMINGGNLMLSGDNDKGYQMTPIDNAVLWKEYTVEGQEVEKLILADESSRSFIAFIIDSAARGASGQMEIFKAIDKDSSNHLKDGVMEGARDIVEQFPTREACEAFIEDCGVGLPDGQSVDSMWAMVQKVKTALNQG